MKRVKVDIPLRPYPVIIGKNSGNELLSQLKKQCRSGRLFVFYDSNFYVLHGRDLNRQLSKSRLKFDEIVLPSGEKAKSEAELKRVQDQLIRAGVKRDDFILACGGGVLSDLVGFAAASTLRGIRWGIVSTTLLSMVDAAIGGKTGINHKLGKNLIGAFWQPSFVICDITYLHTLPSREIVAGLGEILKYAGLIGPEFMRKVSRFLSSGDIFNPEKIEPLIEPSVRYKAEIVAIDERERGLRARLNLGHTFAHGIENSLGYGRLLHGEAVAIGLLAAVNLSVKLKKSREKRLTAYQLLLEDFLAFLPKRVINMPNVLKAMSLDKKRDSGGLRFLLLDAAGKPIIADKINSSHIRGALETALASYSIHGGKNASHSGR